MVLHAILIPSLHYPPLIFEFKYSVLTNNSKSIDCLSLGTLLVKTLHIAECLPSSTLLQFQKAFVTGTDLSISFYGMSPSLHHPYHSPLYSDIFSHETISLYNCTPKEMPFCWMSQHSAQFVHEEVQKQAIPSYAHFRFWNG